MPPTYNKILKYIAFWHPTQNKGEIYAEIENIGRRRIWRGEDKAEFNSIMLVLSTSESPHISSNGWISTGAEEPGYEE